MHSIVSISPSSFVCVQSIVFCLAVTESFDQLFWCLCQCLSVSQYLSLFVSPSPLFQFQPPHPPPPGPGEVSSVCQSVSVSLSFPPPSLSESLALFQSQPLSLSHPLPLSFSTPPPLSLAPLSSCQCLFRAYFMAPPPPPPPHHHHQLSVFTPVKYTTCSCARQHKHGFHPHITPPAGPSRHDVVYKLGAHNGHDTVRFALKGQSRYHSNWGHTTVTTQSRSR